MASSLRLSINDDCDFEKKANLATDKLLKILKEHHDFTIPTPLITATQARKIRHEEAIHIRACEESWPIDVCVLPINQPRITVSAIQRVVCQHFGVSHNELMSNRRDNRICNPRAIAMYLARELTTHGYPTLGKFFGRDHSSVMHAVRKIELTVKRGDPLADQVANLRGVLTA